MESFFTPRGLRPPKRAQYARAHLPSLEECHDPYGNGPEVRYTAVPPETQYLTVDEDQDEQYRCGH